MISFFRNFGTVYAVQHTAPLSEEDHKTLGWLFDGATEVKAPLAGTFIGPRAEMITPWSTNATEIAHTVGIDSVERVEVFLEAEPGVPYDRMLLRQYGTLDEGLFDTKIEKAPLLPVEDLRKYNSEEGLALSDEEIDYLEGVARELGRPLTDAELFGFSQVNSEHCRHKIFGGTFVIDGEEMPESLFGMIKKTSKLNPNGIVSAYADNVAFVEGPEAEFFAPERMDRPDLYRTEETETVLALKAETHNFPTTVEPFNGAATGSGGEIRDRLAGGKACLPLAGAAIYMTPYTRLDKSRRWESAITARPWLYQTPQEILTKASNGASDFGNKFGQPLIVGSLLTFEHQEGSEIWGYDKVIMLAGGVGLARKRDAEKGHAEDGDAIVVMGGDNYRIGMGGGAVSSVNTGSYADAIELNAIQRSNPEMQKRVANVIRAMAEGKRNPIISIHDHGAGGHLNCLSELVEETGGEIDIDRLPIGDPTLSDKEILSNESQERMGILIHKEDLEGVRAIAERERAPFYPVGEAKASGKLVFDHQETGAPAALDLRLSHLFGSAPKTIMEDETRESTFADPDKSPLAGRKLADVIADVQRLESVGSKDWLTNKVDRSVTGKVARQQCCGPLQLPLSDLGAVTLDYRGEAGMAMALGHAPVAAMISAEAGSRLAIAESLTNIVGAPLRKGLESVSLSANWMWPCRNPGEDARLYAAVRAASDFAIALGINIPTGKDSLSMTQTYPDGQRVTAPGTLIVTAGAEVTDVRRIPDPVLKDAPGSAVLYVDFSFCNRHLGGSALYQTLGKAGSTAPDIVDVDYFADAFGAIQELVNEGKVLAIHDLSAGGLITALLEMCYARTEGGLQLSADLLSEGPLEEVLFAENPGVLIQVANPESVMKSLEEAGVASVIAALPIKERLMRIGEEEIDIDEMRHTWQTPSRLMEPEQATKGCAESRAREQLAQPLDYRLRPEQRRTLADYGKSRDRKERSGITCAIIRDKGTNGEREMAYVLWLAGFDVRDVHMSDLMSGRETLEECRMIVFCGGFSHSDVLGAATGFAAGFRYNDRASEALRKFYARPDTLSLGICNGCQLMGKLDLLYGEERSFRLLHNESGKFESTFLTLEIPETNSVMLGSLAGTKLGCWVAHGEGRFDLSADPHSYSVAVRYGYEAYPGNPNGSPDRIAALVSDDGRHLAMMPHPERSVFPWQCGYYPEAGDEVTPWFEAFVNAYEWCRAHR